MCVCDSVDLWWLEKGIRLHGAGIRADCDHHELGDIKQTAVLWKSNKQKQTLIYYYYYLSSLLLA